MIVSRLTWIYFFKMKYTNINIANTFVLSDWGKNTTFHHTCQTITIIISYHYKNLFNKPLEFMLVI